jgi:hypothetical protein
MKNSGNAQMKVVTSTIGSVVILNEFLSNYRKFKIKKKSQLKNEILIWKSMANFLE